MCRILLYKGRGDISEYANYRRVGMLNVPGKLYSRILKRERIEVNVFSEKVVLKVLTIFQSVSEFLNMAECEFCGSGFGSAHVVVHRSPKAC